MNIFESEIKPYIGTDYLSFDMLYDEVKDYLKSNKIKFQVEVFSNKGCLPEVPWTVIRIRKIISIYFAKNKMFKIEFDEGYKGKLFNGIYIGMPMREAESIDSLLIYDDENEDYSSNLGYRIEDDLDTNRVMSITIYIKELLDEDIFFTYDWTEK